MKILHMVNSMNMGGIETLLMNILRNIDRKQYQFTFASVVKEKAVFEDEILKLGSNIIYYPSVNYRNPFVFVKDVKAREKFFVDNNSYDICHIHSSNAVSAYSRAKYALKAGFKKVIVHSHNTKGINEKLNKLYQKKLNKLNIIKLACSIEAGKWLFGDSEFTVINNGIDLSKFYFNMDVRQAKRAELGLDENTKLIGHVGRFNLQKNHSFIIDIFNEYLKINNNAKLLLVGKGELEEEIKAKVDNLGIADKVIFAGLRNDVNELLQAFDVFLFPSLFEGLGIAYIEAAISKLPVLISTEVPFIEVSNAIYSLPLEDASKWAKQIDRCFDISREDTVFNEIAKEYDINYTINSLIEVYNR